MNFTASCVPLERKAVSPLGSKSPWGRSDNQSDAIAAAITAEQHALLAEVRTTVLHDLTEAIADKSSNLTAEAVSRIPASVVHWAG